MKTANLIRNLSLAAILALPMSSIAMEQEPIYGNQLMTQEELQTHQANMKAAKTAEERERIRQENHERLKIRAQEKGIEFPDQPPTERGHINQKNLPGTGMGSGQGR